MSVHDTFYRAGGGFVSHYEDHWDSTPPSIIARLVLDRLPEDAITLPYGWTRDSLRAVRSAAGVPGAEVRYTGRQAAELAQIGRDLLLLPPQMFDAPPTAHERQSIQHLISLAA